MIPQVDLFSFVFLGEIEDTKKKFQSYLTFSALQICTFGLAKSCNFKKIWSLREKTICTFTTYFLLFYESELDSTKNSYQSARTSWTPWNANPAQIQDYVS